MSVPMFVVQGDWLLTYQHIGYYLGDDQSHHFREPGPFLELYNFIKTYNKSSLATAQIILTLFPAYRKLVTQNLLHLAKDQLVHETIGVNTHPH